MTLTTEFEVLDKVYYFKEDGIVEGYVRSVRFPPYNRLSLNPKSEDIEYGLITTNQSDNCECNFIHPFTEYYTYRRARQMGRSPQELIDKMMKLYDKKNKTN